MKKLVALIPILLLLFACAQEQTETKTAEIVSTKTLTEMAESNPDYWGYIDYVWTKDGEAMSDESLAAYVIDWVKEADATGVPYNSYGYIPVEATDNYDGIWVVAWKSKALRDQAWEKWIANGSRAKLDAAHPDTIMVGGENYEDVYSFYSFRPREPASTEPWAGVGTSEKPYNIDASLCSFKDGQGFDQLRDVLTNDFYPWLDTGVEEYPGYTFSIEVPENQDADFDYLWKNLHPSAALADSGNADFQATGVAIQEKFDQVANCNPMTRFDGYFIKLEEEA